MPSTRTMILVVIVASGAGYFALYLSSTDLSESRPATTDEGPVHNLLTHGLPIIDRNIRSFDDIDKLLVSTSGYVGSDACRDCHQENHQSWWDSYHRTMTQKATPQAVLADFQDQTVTVASREFGLRCQDGVCMVNMEDPDVKSNSLAQNRIDRPIVMTTGSHHMQVYWYATGNSHTLGQFPLVWLKETNDWVPRQSIFLRPPDPTYKGETGRWNKTCNRCHTTFPRAKHVVDEQWNTQVAEMGISCEACHGPGAKHVARYANSASDTQQSDPVVNPARLSHQLSSQVCGQCHSMVIPKHQQNANFDGSPYRPGGDLLDSHFLIKNDEVTRSYYAQYMNEESLNAFMALSFYPDGMIRVSGREYNGLVDSPCFQKGELSCLSCHQMHQSDDDPRTARQWADDQLSFEHLGQAMCTQCHQTSEYGPKHTHHLADSSGSQCINCHMPHTTYGLLKAIRSHQISSPNIKVDEAARRPNACNQCHLDQTLAWSADYLKQWYEIDTPEFDKEQSTVAASILWALRGDAGQRALAAWNMSWPEATEASGDSWQAPFLAELLIDPYDAVRFIAHRSLKNLDATFDIEFDFVGPKEHRLGERQRVIQRWQDMNHVPNDHVLIDPDGKLNSNVIERLIENRDDRDVNLVE